MIYVHVPFCRSFCTYCGFYSETAPDCPASLRRFEAYAGRVCEEAAARRSEIEGTLDVNTLYIGGGTPSVLPLSILGRIVGALPFGPYDEFTVEVNPEDIVEKGLPYLEGLLGLGVNRISMGVQSLDDGILRWMNRRHDAARAREAFRLIRKAGFGNVSIDLIFGIPSLTDESWQATLDEVVGWNPEHISAYQLSVEEGSALDNSGFVEAPDELCRRQYDMLCSALRDAGYAHYEISNFARPGFQARHNSAYWRRAPYVGLGPGAHSFMVAKEAPEGISSGKTVAARGLVNGRGPLACKDSGRDEGCGATGSFSDELPSGAVCEIRSWNSESENYTSECEVRGTEDILTEKLMLPLRTACGVEAEALAGNPAAERLLEEGALVRAEGRIRIPEDHFFVCDDIIRQLI